MMEITRALHSLGGSPSTISFLLPSGRRYPKLPDKLCVVMTSSVVLTSVPADNWLWPTCLREAGVEHWGVIDVPKDRDLYVKVYRFSKNASDSTFQGLQPLQPQMMEPVHTVTATTTFNGIWILLVWVLMLSQLLDVGGLIIIFSIAVIAHFCCSPVLCLCSSRPEFGRSKARLIWFKRNY